MGILLKWFNEHKEEYHPLVMAAIFHQKFEIIHPFHDGNGRTGRMVMNYMLMQAGFPPMIIQKKNRSTYLDVLGEANKVDLDKVDHRFQDLVDFTVEEMNASYWSHFLV
jgi:Fic family protein